MSMCPESSGKKFCQKHLDDAVEDWRALGLEIENNGYWFIKWQGVTLVMSEPEVRGFILLHYLGSWRGPARDPESEIEFACDLAEYILRNLRKRGEGGDVEVR